MKNRNAEELFALIKSLSKHEKRNFHLYARRNQKKDKLKVLAVYNAISKLKIYDEKELLEKLKGITPSQLYNFKIILFNLLLDSLRIINKKENIEMQLGQMMDYARILYERSFHSAALKALKRVKVQALSCYQVSIVLQALVLEKKIEMVYGSNLRVKIELLNNEMQQNSEQLFLIFKLSNLAMQLHSYLQYARTDWSENFQKSIDLLYASCLQAQESAQCFYSRLYFLQALTYYYFFTNNIPQFFKEAHKWVTHFNNHPQMKEVESLQYQRGLAYLNEAALQLNNEETLEYTVSQFHKTEDGFYKLITQLNLCLFKNDFNHDLLNDIFYYISNSNHHERIILLCHKASKLCLVSDLFNRVIDFTHKGLQVKTSYRPDLQYQLRLYHIEAHKKLGNDEIIEYLQQSTRRFQKKNGLETVF